MGEYINLFAEQYGELPYGGFLNPVVIEKTDIYLLFRRNYDNFESDENCWHYGFDLETREFYEA